MDDYDKTEWTSKKEIILKDGKYNLTRLNPYGFIKISAERGQVPESLQGSYTTYDQAEVALRAYLGSKGREIIEVKR